MAEGWARALNELIDALRRYPIFAVEYNQTPRIGLPLVRVPPLYMRYDVPLEDFDLDYIAWIPVNR